MAKKAMENGYKLILGSQSMARKQILAEMGYDFTIVTADIDEKAIRKEKPEDLAEAKANEIILKLGGENQFTQDSQPTLLITADTVVVYKGWDKAEVYFHEIPEHVIDDLIDDAITFKVAGGLMLEHPLISPFIDSVVGGVDTVMGLSKELTEKFINDVL
ncbi:Maf-like protein [Arabidopsis thaliana x Arabidopsis arenosa]|uniref:Maf-like protein n=2 Tax=Arabidopsis TaxID=3701 RepID=A0A8T2FSB1_9BRAS|nr:Maf-like protein [Arabidopsis thaliana x Arabidopsis arenosa]OAP08525.1 hypothetical protein AXX17_AT2G21300 [Arabidopsis thaliana]CAD5319485.1 unnamed protein product [Arabidopsis thaliana]